MAELTLKQLIQIAKLSEEVKKNALANLDKMNEQQKFRLSQLCWESLVNHYENEARFEYERMLEEMANGEKEYGPDDFKTIEDRVITELLSRIEGIKTKEQIEEVKEELQKHLNQPQT